MKAYYVKQGDEFSIPLTIRANGEALDDETASLIEVMVGHELRKTWPGDITYDDENAYWLLPLTQAETFAFVPQTEIPVDIRVMLSSGAVLGVIEAVRLRVVDALSTEVLS